MLKRWAECPECERQVRVSLKWGQAYSHAPDMSSEALCAGSGALLAAPDPVEVLPVAEPVGEPVEVFEAPRYDFGPSVSVRSVSGGLPTHGKRRP